MPSGEAGKLSQRSDGVLAAATAPTGTPGTAGVESTKRGRGRVLIEGACIQVVVAWDDDRMCTPCVQDKFIRTNCAGGIDHGALVGTMNITRILGPSRSE